MSAVISSIPSWRGGVASALASTLPTLPTGVPILKCREAGFPAPRSL